MGKKYRALRILSSTIAWIGHLIFAIAALIGWATLTDYGRGQAGYRILSFVGFACGGAIVWVLF